ncbi:MAG: M81 family metallopeptidase [Oscillospiraceae bacterium]|nr:M81 family metallopeptidase [Oscillospiraceae bacterium]
MRVLAAHFYHESNTFAPGMTRREDFSCYSGSCMLDKLAGLELLEEAGVEIVPAFYASRWSSGTVSEDAFLSFEQELLQLVRREMPRLDGIWLSLHGGMTVERIGSGEYRLLQDLRPLVGERPIAVSLDMHANNRPGMEQLANLITGYHTAPHVDTEQTQRKAVRGLLKLLRTGQQVHPALARVPMLLCGERAVTSMEPLKSLFERCRRLEADDRFLAASLFVGMAWGDTPDTAVTAVVTPSSPEYAEDARREAQQLAEELFARREECAYAHPAFPPEEAVRQALRQTEGPVFLADSGDNPTAGGCGWNTVLLREMLKQRERQRVLFAPIYDSAAVTALSHRTGETLSFRVGMDRDPWSSPVTVTGQVVRTGTVLARHGQVQEPLAGYVLVTSDGLDLILTDSQASFTGMECFESAGVDPSDYDVVVVKMGYLFAELAPCSKGVILALTPGCTPLTVTAEQYHHLQRPIWPLDPL